MFAKLREKYQAWRRAGLEQDLQEVKDEISRLKSEGRDEWENTPHPKTNAEWYELNKRKFGRVWRTQELDEIQKSLEKQLGIIRPEPAGNRYSW